MSVRWVKPSTDERPGGGVLRRRLVLAPHPTDHDPFLLWGEDWFEKGAFGWHPHRGFETASFLVAGSLAYEDSSGNRGTMHAGDLLWTTAGAGFQHTADPVSDEAHGLQLWINLPAGDKMCSPREQRVPHDEAPTFGTDGFTGHVYAGRCGELVGPVKARAEATFVALEFTAGRLQVPTDPGHVGTLFVVSGALRVDAHQVQEGHAARIEHTDAFTCEASQPGLALFISGAPLREPVVMDGPFVMNTQAEIDQAYADAESGVIPRPPVVEV